MIVYYINLAHRTDRREQIEKELERSPWPVQRVEAVHVPDYGIVGCGLSHIKTLRMFLESPHDHCIIFEDDFQFTRPLEELSVPGVEWDVVMLGGNVLSQGPYTRDLNQVYDAQTTSGYMITKNFAKILLENMEEGLALLQKTRNRIYSLDIYWKKLQPMSRWYIFNPKFGKQRPSYSDIEQCAADYGV
jgi:glycosyl transferase family 25